MHKKTEFIIFASVLIILVTLLFFAFNSSSSSIFANDKEQQLNNYIDNVRTSQTKSQRDSTISLYAHTIESGSKNNGKVLTPEQAPEICELSKSIATKPTSEEQAEQLAIYLSKEIEYDWGNIIVDTTGKPRTRVTKNPKEVLETGKAICGELANTYILMSECVDIDSYFIYGGGHAWNVAYINEIYYEVDTTQGCFDCDISKPEHSYPILGLCNLDKCISISQIASLAASQQTIFDQTMGK
jgi:transglutaminase/protease-like cytokinesis protein 3